MIRNVTFFVLITFILVLSACSALKTKQADCINDVNKDLVISWGIYIPSTGVINGYKINTECQVSKFTSKNLKDEKSDIIGKIDHSVYCRNLSEIQSSILKTQALNAPGDTLKFFEYSNPKMSEDMRAVWNPKFKHSGNVNFVVVYDSLEAIIHYMK